MEVKKHKGLDDAGRLFLWKIKEASQGYRKNVKKLFGKSFASSTLHAFDEAIDNFTSEYMNDVNTVFSAFSENMEQLIEPEVKPESERSDDEDDEDPNRERQPKTENETEHENENNQENETADEQNETTDEQNETSEAQNDATEEQNQDAVDYEQAVLQLDNHHDEKSDLIRHIKQEDNEETNQLSSATTDEQKEHIRYEAVTEMEFAADGPNQEFVGSDEVNIKGEDTGQTETIASGIDVNYITMN